jgi:hypothetical protein
LILFLKKMSALPLRLLDHSSLNGIERSVDRTQSISSYIDTILSLIPSKLYIGSENIDGQSDAIDNARDGKYAKRKKNPYPEQGRKEGSKKGLKRARSESAAPGAEDGAESSKSDVVHQSDVNSNSAATGFSSSSSSSSSSSNVNGGIQNARLASSIDELRERLHARIEALKSKRGERGESSLNTGKIGEGKSGDGVQQNHPKKSTTTLAASTSSSQPSHQQHQHQQKKHKGAAAVSSLESEQVIRNNSSNSNQVLQQRSKQPQAQSTQQHVAKKQTTSSSSLTLGAPASSSSSSVPPPLPLDVEFGHLSQALPGALAVSTLSIKPLKASKEHRIRDQLKKAAKYKESLASLAQQGEEGVQKKITLEFNHALSRAQGEKVHDDPTLLAKALKRRKKEKSKSHADWSKRKSKEKAEMKDRQAERTKNLNNKKNRALKRGDRPPVSSSSHEGGGKGGGDGGSGSGSGGAPSRPSPVAASAQNRPGFEGRRGGFGK